MPTPRPPTAYEDAAWLRRGRELLRPPKEETVWQIAGFPMYRFYDDQLWHLSGPDAAGRLRRRRAVAALTKSGCRGWNLRRNGCACWVGLVAMRGLLVRA